MSGGTILVTGTSSGIGRACAVELAGRGFHVLAGVRDEADGEAVRALHPDRIEPLMLDVTDAEAIERLPERVGGALAGLVNNAGYSRPGPIEYVPVDDIRAQLDVMLVAPFALVHTLLPALRAARGRVVNIGSIGGRVGLPFNSPSHAAKAGIASMSDSLRQELGPVGVHVALVEPGSIATSIWERGLAAGDELLEALPETGRRLYGDRLDRLRKAAEMMAKRGVPPAKVADVVAHALTADRPRTRYLVGVDARAQALLRAALPDRALDAVIGRVSGVR
jgi:NAD(P)-dependent dehydrogenase (short-subunit alcohol dehydrogenase family)